MKWPGQSLVLIIFLLTNCDRTFCQLLCFSSLHPQQNLIGFKSLYTATQLYIQNDFLLHTCILKKCQIYVKFTNSIGLIAWPTLPLTTWKNTTYPLLNQLLCPPSWTSTTEKIWRAFGLWIYQIPSMHIPVLYH